MVERNEAKSRQGDAMIEQGSDEWKMQRMGNLTASRMSAMLAGGKGVTRANLMAELVCERLTGKWMETFESADMRRGTELEPIARANYEAATGNMVLPAAYTPHPTIPHFGASPDGLVDSDGLLEIKCLTAANHILILRNGSYEKYLPQVHTQMMCGQRQWVDLTFFHPDFPDYLQLKVIRIHADAGYHKRLETEAMRFLAELNVEIQSLQDLKKAA